MYKVITFLLFILTLQLFAFVYQKNLQILDLEERLRSEVAKNQVQIKDKAPTLLAPVSSGVALLKASPVAASVDNPISTPEPLTRPEWQAKYMLREVEQHLALTASEKEELQDKFRNGSKLSDISKVVGVERAKQFLEASEASLEEEENEEIKDKQFKLSRVLNLTSEQESALNPVLKSIQIALRPSYSGLKEQAEHGMELHSQENSGPELRELYEKYRLDLENIRGQENQLLSEKLKNILTEDQFNKFLEYQATSKPDMR
jgi:hypothetical protein